MKFWNGINGWGNPPATDSSTIYVPPSGDTTGATDRANIQAAIDAATETHTELTNSNAFFSHGKATAIALIGKYTINGVLTMKQGVWLRGHSWLGSTVHLAPGSNSSMLVWPDKTYWTGVADIHFDGHAESQTAGGAAIDCSAGGAITVRGDSCAAPFLERIMVTYAYGSGIKIAAVEARISDCYVYRAGNHGFEMASSDSFMYGCASGDSRKAGFYFAGGQHHVTSCKSWWSGYYQADRAKLAQKTVGPNEPGFHVQGSSNVFTNCDAQDTSGPGWKLAGGSNMLVNCVSDDSAGGGFYIYGAEGNTTIDGHVRSVHGGVMPYLVKIESWATTRNCNIKIGVPEWGINGGMKFTQGVIYTGTGVPEAANVVRLGNPERTFTTTYAATITPDPIFGGVDVTLTGPVTIANTVADRSPHGTELSIMLTQDATGGRTVSWGSGYVGMSAADTAAGKVNWWRIRRVNGKWVQIGFTSWELVG